MKIGLAMSAIHAEVVVALCLLSLAGCASSFMSNRAADARDIFTLTGGVGLGARARAGVLHAGLNYTVDAVGLRGGEWKGDDAAGEAPGKFYAYDWDLLLLSAEEFRFWQEGAILRPRNKLYEAGGGPLLVVAGRHPAMLQGFPLYYYTQIEVSAHFLYGVRLGFNPGELVDFLIGWTTLDMYDDDIGRTGMEVPIKPVGAPKSQRKPAANAPQPLPAAPDNRPPARTP